MGGAPGSLTELLDLPFIFMDYLPSSGKFWPTQEAELSLGPTHIAVITSEIFMKLN